MSSILALDIGMKRTGIAKGDMLGIAIKPLKTIETVMLIDELQELISEYSIEKIFIGIPENMEGRSQETTNFIKEQSKKIQAEFSKLEIIFLNEAYSSREAEARLKARGIKISKESKKLVDMEAAAILLEQAFRDGP